MPAGIPATLGLALSLSACSLFSGPPPETFDLSGPESVRVGGSTAAQILVPEASAIKVLDTERIVVVNGPTITYYPKAQWPDRLPKLFQDRAIQAFERSKRVRAVGRPGEGMSIDYQLLTTIRSFEYRSDEGVARIEVTAKVMDDRNGRVVATKVFVSNAPVVKDDAAEVVAAVQAALDSVLTEIVRWTIGTI